MVELSNVRYLEERARYLASKLSLNEFDAIKMAEKELKEQLENEGEE